MQKGFLTSSTRLILVSDNSTFQKNFFLYSSSPFFSAHHNFFKAYLHFLQLNMTMIVLEGELPHKFINFVYIGHCQRMISHSKVWPSTQDWINFCFHMWKFSDYSPREPTQFKMLHCITHSAPRADSHLTDRKSPLIIWVSIHWDSSTFTSQVGKLNTMLLSHYQQSEERLNKPF